MGKFIDLTGQRFGRLVVLKNLGTNKDKKYIYLCKCDCGNNKEVIGEKLKQGDTKSCGCLQRERASASNRKNFVGQKFSRLLVLEHLGTRKDGGGIFNSWYKCQCDCGNICEALGATLQSGGTKSCGCYKIEKISEISRKDFTGKKFGILLVLEHLGTRKNESNKYNSWYRCKCDCGNIIEVSGHALQRGNTKSCGCLKESYVVSELKKYFIENYCAFSEYRIVKNPKTSYYLPYDIYIPNERAFIEVQGEQHYKQSTFFHEKLKNIKYRDKIKKKYAQKNGIFIEVDLRKEKTVDEWIFYIEEILFYNQKVIKNG